MNVGLGGLGAEVRIETGLDGGGRCGVMLGEVSFVGFYGSVDLYF